jgi:hypothetical protein
MITSINEFKKLNEYHVDMPKKIQLTYVRTDDNGNFIYKGNDGEIYQDVEGVIHDVTDQGEPLSPVHNVEVIKGQPIYNSEDRFGRNPGSKVAESVINESLISNDEALKVLSYIQTKYDSIFQIVKSEFKNAQYSRKDIIEFDDINDDYVIDYLTEGEESSSVKFSFFGSDMINTKDIIKIVNNLKKYKIDFYRILSINTKPGYLEFVVSVEIEDLQNWK